MQESAQVCFDQWLRDWEIVDEWLMDACRHTLQAWATEIHAAGGRRSTTVTHCQFGMAQMSRILPQRAAHSRRFLTNLILCR
jgi:hypothetical protein